MEIVLFSTSASRGTSLLPRVRSSSLRCRTLPFATSPLEGHVHSQTNHAARIPPQCQPQSYLFRVKTAAEAEALRNAINAHIPRKSK